MKTVTIDDICEVVTDGTHYTPPDVGEGIPFLTVKDMSEQGLDFTGCSYITLDEYIKADLGNSAPKIGDVLFSKDGTVGKVHVVSEERQFAVLSSIAILRPKIEILDSQYFGHILRSPSTLDQAIRRKTGSAIRRIILKDLKQVQIPLPPLEEQRRIAAILDKADAVRRKRQEAIALTEELLRSAFLDMFGDPVTNPKGWGSGTILDVVANPKTDVRCGPFGTQLKVEEIVSEGIPMLGIENVKGGRFQASTSKYLTPSKAKELAAFNVQAGDVLVTRMGTIGHACVVPQGIGEARISYHLFRIRPNPDYCLPGFLASTITWSGTFLTQLERLAHGAIMAGLKTADLKEVRFLVPPVDLQKQYLKIVAETEKLLENQKKRIISDDALFNSLLQRAFQGEL